MNGNPLLDYIGLEKYTDKLNATFTKTSTFSIYLMVDNWINSEQIISNPLFNSDTKYSYIVSPNSENASEYIKAGILAFDVKNDGEMKFVCKNNPENDLLVYILKMEV